MSGTCIRCQAGNAVDELELCRRCRWAVRIEIEEGFYRLQRYLLCWDRYRAWCADRGVAA